MEAGLPKNIYSLFKFDNKNELDGGQITMTNIDLMSVLFWAVLAAYVVHIIDETLMGKGFTQLVKEHWWPEYHIEMFFWFNTGFIIAIVLSIVSYDCLGGHWIILPLFWAFERAFHIIALHLWWGIRYKEYSPGLLSGILFWILIYFIVRYGLNTSIIKKDDFVVGAVAGFFGGLLLSLLPTVIMPAIQRRKKRK